MSTDGVDHQSVAEADYICKKCKREQNSNALSLSTVSKSNTKVEKQIRIMFHDLKRQKLIIKAELVFFLSKMIQIVYDNQKLLMSNTSS